MFLLSCIVDFDPRINNMIDNSMSRITFVLPFSRHFFDVADNLGLFIYMALMFIADQSAWRPRLCHEYSAIVDDLSLISRRTLCEVRQYVADALAHSLLTKNKPRLFGDVSVLNCRIYCDYRRTYAVIILRSRFTPNVRPISANVH